MTAKELIAQRIKLGQDANLILDKAQKEARALSVEERETVKRLDAEFDAVTAKINEEAAAGEEERNLRARFAEREAELSESRGRKTQTTLGDGAAEPSEEEADLAMRAWFLGSRATPEMLEAAQRCGLNPRNPEMNIGIRERRSKKTGELVRSFVPVIANRDGDILGVEQRALSVGTTTAGGNAVSNEMMRSFVDTQKWYARFREAADQIQTETGGTLPWPNANDTGNTGRILAEATAATTTTDPTFGVVNLGAFKFSSDGVLVSWEVLQDSFIPIDTKLGNWLARRVGRIQNTKFTVGAGTTEPKGIIPGLSVGVTAAATNAFTFDDVISLVHSLDLAYRSLPGTGFMLHDTVAAAVRKFKDGTGRYIWEMSTQLGQPDRLLGYPVLINNDMAAAFTTGQKLMAFGHWKSAYLVRDAGAIRFVRADELYVKEHQVYFEASQRSDGNVVDTSAGKVLALG